MILNLKIKMIRMKVAFEKIFVIFISKEGDAFGYLSARAFPSKLFSQSIFKI
jgi:hypothetical protein